MMYLKRVYEPGSVKAGKPKVAHMKVMSAPDRWHVSPRVVEKGAAEGWLGLADGRLTIKTAPDEADVVYRIELPPGHYCCHCQLPQPNSLEAMKHVTKAHAAQPSPDPANPTGIRKDNFYSCVREANG